MLNKQKAFTLGEMLIALVIVGLMAVLIMPILTQNNNAKNPQIAEGLKSDIQKAFQLDTSSNGLIQKSDGPSSIVAKALNLSNGVANGSNTNYTTPAGWQVIVPNNWSTGTPDQAVINITPPGGNSYNITVYRDNVGNNGTNTLASVTPSDPGSSTTAPIASTVTPAPTAPATPSAPSITLGDVTFKFKYNGSYISLSSYTLSLTCNGNSIPVSGASVSNLMPSSNCTVSGSGLNDGTHGYTSTPTSFTVVAGSQTVDLTLTQVPNNYPVSFAFSGTDASSINNYKLSVTCPAGPSGNITSPAAKTVNLQENLSGCIVTATNMSSPTHSYQDTSLAFNTTNTAKTVTIPVTQIINNVPVNFNFTLSNGTAVAMATHVGSISCNDGSNYSLPIALSLSLDSTLVCNATFTGLSDSTNRGYTQVNIPQSFNANSGNVNIIVKANVNTYQAGFISSILDTGAGQANRSLADLLSWHPYYQDRVMTSFQTLLGNKYNNVMNSTQYLEAEDVALMTSDGTVRRIPWEQFVPNLTINGQSWLSWAYAHGGHSNQTNLQEFGWGDSTNYRGYLYGTGFLTGTGLNLPSDQTSLSSFNIVYTDPSTGDIYNINALFLSPVKINLKGKDAVTTDNGGFKFDVDGFHNNATPIMNTTGGLNNDEAWLALDRGNTGIYKNGVMDGDALFGDHLGLYPSGYEDMAQTFKASIKQDDTSKQYIELTPEPWWVNMWNGILKFFGIKTAPSPYNDLKLVTSDNHILNANTVIKRLDITYKRVNEYSSKKNTAIFQRADVYYIDGHKASGADLWFKPQWMMTKKK